MALKMNRGWKPLFVEEWLSRNTSQLRYPNLSWYGSTSRGEKAKKKKKKKKKKI
jgi:hypothetical protein